MARFEINDVLKGVQVYFDNIPSEEIRNKLKAAGYRWHRANKYWYAKQNENTMAVANEVCGNDEFEVEPEIENEPVETETANSRYCYQDSIENFMSLDENSFISQMETAFRQQYILPLEELQITAWRDCFKSIKHNLGDIATQFPGLSIIFEYALPYESGRRPDVILLSGEQVIILEYKMKNQVRNDDLDQAAAYGRDIREYHFESREKEVIPFLVLTRTKDYRVTRKGVRCCSDDILADELFSVINIASQTDASAWINSVYTPLPTIVDAAKTFMNHQPLPQIRQVNSTGIPDAIELLKSITEEAKMNKTHTLALVTGVPGAGKTYLGLQYVYDICESSENVNSVYLSGNGPLIKVLTDALNSNVFVKSIHTVVNEHLAGRGQDFNKNVIVFDEGQRAWDSNQMSSKRHTSKSEPDVLVELCDQRLDWCVLLILVGEGQEINNGENSGLAQWNSAISLSQKEWDVICPDKLSEVFSGAASVRCESYLNLDTSLRTHTAGEVSRFVNTLISGKIDEARAIADRITGYDMYYTRDLQVAKNYCRNRYAGSNQRYGLMASSKGKSLEKYGMKPKFQPDVAAWFNKPVTDAASGCALNITISEFDCQGLEVSMPIVGWADDMLWNNGRWVTNAATGTDAEDYRINSYRVLLTRGRDGFFVFVPQTSNMDSVAEVLEAAGVKKYVEE